MAWRRERNPGGGYCAPVLEDVVFAHNVATGTATLFCYNECNVTLRNATMVMNEGGSVGGIVCGLGTQATITNSIVALSVAGQAVACNQGSVAMLACCDLYGNAGGDWVGCVADQADVNGNMRVDPQFCIDVMPHHGWHLHVGSPCAPGGNPGCGLVGARGVACGASPADSRSWGAVKAMFR